MNLDPEILADLRDLHEQATKERSHYYTGKVVERAIKVITRQNAALAECHKEIFKLRSALINQTVGGGA